MVKWLEEAVKNFLFALIVALVSGCCSVPEDVAESADVLRDNTYSLAVHYEALIERAGPPVLKAAPEGETTKALVARTKKREEAWDGYVKHKKALMSVNNILADRLATWTAICAGKTKVEEPEDKAEDETQPEAEDEASEGDGT